ncbi:MAG: hypothetical protein L3K17_00800 [Thermoplasmata archaeon]|nr:hypothetical protein [Thermoplasmata archaeon]
MEQRNSVKSFVGKPVGRLLIAALATATLIGSFLLLSPVISIPTFLFFGLAIPIYLGWKRPRQLAIMGLAVLLVAAPIGSLWEAQIVRQPSPLGNSDNFAPYGNGGSVLQNAHVTPFDGAGGATYNFSVEVFPQYVPANTSGLLWVELFVTTCVGATGNNSPYCPTPYPFYSPNSTLPSNLTSPSTVYFDQPLSGSNIWWFQFATAYRSGPDQNLTWIFLDPNNGYGAIEGPVSGSYTSTVELVIPSLYQDMFFYPGAVFFLALLIYYVFKRREAARQGGAGPGSPPASSPDVATSSPSTGSPPAGSPKGSAPARGAAEMHCPNCQAVVYANETSCWKCGAALTRPVPAAEAPLAGGRT